MERTKIWLQVVTILLMLLTLIMIYRLYEDKSETRKEISEIKEYMVEMKDNWIPVYIVE
jgi:hypothetical protein